LFRLKINSTLSIRTDRFPFIFSKASKRLIESEFFKELY